MKVNINMDRIMDLMIEANNATADYYKSSRTHYKKHGYGVQLDRATTPEEKHIVYAYHEDNKTNDAVCSIVQVLGFDREQYSRLRIACRAITRWYERETRWERNAPADLLERISNFVVGEGA